MKRTKEKAEETRQELIGVALKVFNEKGYTATRLEDIAKAAGVTRGAIYHHFGSKADLFKAMVAENKNITQSYVQQIVEEGTEKPLGIIQRIMKDMIKRLENDEYFRSVQELLYKTELTGELKDLQIEFSAHSQFAFDEIKKTLVRAKELGRINKDVNENVFAFSVISFYVGVMFTWIINKDLISVEQEAENLVNVLFAQTKI